MVINNGGGGGGGGRGLQNRREEGGGGGLAKDCTRLKYMEDLFFILFISEHT